MWSYGRSNSDVQKKMMKRLDEYEEAACLLLCWCQTLDSLEPMWENIHLYIQMCMYIYIYMYIYFLTCGREDRPPTCKAPQVRQQLKAAVE